MKRERNSINESQSNSPELKIGTSQSQNYEVVDYNRVLPDSNYSINLEQANNLWPHNHTKLSDLFTSKIILPNGKAISTPTHMIGQVEADIKLIAYNDDNEQFQEDVARFVKPNEVAIAIKHHSPNPEVKEKMKLQCTHIQIVVGVMSGGKAGVLTVNNPQGYQAGLFGAADYPMIFIKPVFPSVLSNDKIIDYVNNIRTWLVIANTFTHFPSNYDGGGPLATRNVEQVKQLGNKLLSALLGDQEAVDWLESPLNQVYCAELAHVALNLGLHYPLNSHFVEQEHFELVKQQIIRKDFIKQNENPYIGSVSTCVAPDDLVPIIDVINADSASSSGSFDKNLAIKPLTVANIIEKYIQFSVPRKELGEEISNIQAAMLKECQSAVFTALGVGQLPHDSENRMLVSKLYEEIISCVEKTYENYNQFEEAISPLLDKTKAIVSPRDNGEGAFIPPHCFLIRATESIKGRTDIGVLKWQYIGHGLHESILKKVN